MNNWLGRVIIFLIVGAGSILSLHYITSHFKSDRQLILLNTTRPDFNKLLDLDEKNMTDIPKGSLREYFDYFRLVNEAMPDNNDGLLMLGYLYEITGDKTEALAFLTKAHRLDPSFFFTNFDLGLLSYEQGDYAQSADLLQNALGVAPERTLNQMMNSMVYRQVFSSMKDSHEIITGLEQAYHDAYVLLIEVSKQKELQGENVVPPEVHAHIM